MWLSLLFVVVSLLVPALVHHFVVIPGNYLRWLNQPLDGGLNMKRKPLLGRAKTWRGVVFMSVGTGLIGGVFGLIFPSVRLNLTVDPSIAGGLLGLAYSLGELPNSFIKRRLDISSSEKGQGKLGCLFELVDQTDSIIAVAIMILFLFDRAVVSFEIVVIGVIMGIWLHPFFDRLLYKFGYKKNLNYK